MYCHIITEGMIGTQNQCVGVSNALHLDPKITQIGLSQPWRTLTPWFGFEQSFTFTPRLQDPFPDLLITSGRKSIAASRYIKKHNGKKTFSLYIQNPKIKSSAFDLIAAPYHDNIQGDNIIVTDGAPNKITADLLADAKKEFSSLFKSLPNKKIAVLIGGNSKTHTLTQEKTIEIANTLSKIDSGLMITASRRTGDKNIEILKSKLNGDNVYFYDGKGENPYFGMLAHADVIIATNDSVSMLSDAGTTGKPVYTINLDGGSKRFDRLYSHFLNLGIIRPLPQNIEGDLEQWQYEPLSDAQKVADEVRKRMG